jgi:hypothetical protein
MLPASLDCPFSLSWQHRIHKTHDKYMLENTEGVMEKDNPEKLAT